MIREHRRDIGIERTDRIVVAFTATSLHHKAAPRAAADGADRAAVADICHGLRSAAQMLGLVKIGSGAETLEDVARGETDSADLIAMAEAFCTEMDIATAALHDFDAN